MPECWAKDISPCEGPQSGEHYVSKGLIDPNGVIIRGLPFCDDEFVKISVSSLKANILCKRHNEMLSELDTEAKRFRDGLFARRADTNESHLPIRISGPRFSRWIAKTFCNFMVIGKHPLDNGFIRHSFGSRTVETYRLYLWRPLRGHLRRIGIRPTLEEDHFQFSYFYDRPMIIVFVRFFGLRFVFTNYDARKDPVIECGEQHTIDTRDLEEQPRGIQLRHELGEGKISAQYEVFIDWPT